MLDGDRRLFVVAIFTAEEFSSLRSAGLREQLVRAIARTAKAAGVGGAP